MRRVVLPLLGPALLAATPALAQDKPDEPRFCPTRPSLAASSCTTDPGHVQFEASAIDWQLDRGGGGREDRVVAADLLARLGVGPKTEVQVGWTAFGHDRTRDEGGTQVVNGTGDVVLAVRQHLAGEEGKPFSAGIQPFVSLPVGRYPVGAGTWAAGVQAPVQYELTKKLSATATGEVDAAANESGAGRHLAYDGIATLRYKLTPDVNVYAEVEVQRDRDPDGATTQALAAFSVAWRPTRRFQLDALAIAGLNAASPDIRLVTGGAILF